jgi:hypothetical protein
MPFTISHIAAVAPFSRPLARWRLLSATVIGSMVPDFGFLMPWRPPRIDTHSAIALVSFCLPLGLATFWLFQRVIKTPIIEVLPDGAYLRWLPWMRPADIRSPPQWILAACGVELGALTHLVWDGFTHEGARGVRMIPSLDDPILDFAGHELAGVRFLQDVSSLLGLMVVFAVAVYCLRPGLPGAAAVRRLTQTERQGWMIAYVVMTGMLAGLFLGLRHPHYQASNVLSLILGNYAIASLRGFAAAVVLVSLALQLRLRAMA